MRLCLFSNSLCVIFIGHGLFFDDVFVFFGYQSVSIFELLWDFFLFLFSLLDMWIMIIFYYCDCIVSWLPLDFSFYFWFLWGMMILMTCKLNVMVVSRSRWSGVLLFVRAYVLCAWLINCWISCLSSLSLIVYLIHKGFYSLVDLLKIV